MVLSKSKSDALLSKIRDGLSMTRGEKFNLIVALSVPSILAQVTSVLMFYIDASMVGSLGTEASAAIGLVEPASWLFGSLTAAASMGFAVQVAHFIGANDFSQARHVMKHSYLCCLLFSFILMGIAVAISGHLPLWLGGGADISGDASAYFLIYSLSAPFFMLENLSSAMLKSSGDMRHPSAIAVLTCVLDVVFNFLFIFPTRTLTVAGISFTMPGAGLGVEGAALGTALAFVVTAIMLCYYAVWRNDILAWRKDRVPFVWNAGYVREAFKHWCSHGLTVRAYEWRADRLNNDCRAVGQRLHCGQLLRSNRRESVLYARLRYRRRRVNPRGSDLWC